MENSATANKYLLLRKAYEIALQEMPRSRWQDCCVKAISLFKEIGMVTCTNHQTLMKWNRYFRTHLYLERDPKHKLPKLFEPKLFCEYPEARAMIYKHFSKLLDEVSVVALCTYVITTLIDKLVLEEKKRKQCNNNNNRTTNNKIKK